jgi:hypothetical protein
MDITEPKLTIVKSSLPENGERVCGILTITRIGGSHDGEVMRMMDCEMSDGTIRRYLDSNARPGFFKQVTVPWDFEHPKILE